MSPWLLLGLAAFFYWAYRKADAGRPKRRPMKLAAAAPAPHELLGVGADASPDEIRKAYQRKVREYHPDRVAGAAPEIVRLAEQRTKELNAAYQALLRGR